MTGTTEHNTRNVNLSERDMFCHRERRKKKTTIKILRER